MSLGSQVLTAEIKKSVAESGEPRSEADDLNIALEILVCIYIEDSMERESTYTTDCLIHV